jgi:hypothetical protein
LGRGQKTLGLEEIKGRGVGDHWTKTDRDNGRIIGTKTKGIAVRAMKVSSLSTLNNLDNGTLNAYTSEA